MTNEEHVVFQKEICIPGTSIVLCSSAFYKPTRYKDQKKDCALMKNDTTRMKVNTKRSDSFELEANKLKLQTISHI